MRRYDVTLDMGIYNGKKETMVRTIKAPSMAEAKKEAKKLGRKEKMKVLKVEYFSKRERVAANVAYACDPRSEAYWSS